MEDEELTVLICYYCWILSFWGLILFLWMSLKDKPAKVFCKSLAMFLHNMFPSYTAFCDAEVDEELLRPDLNVTFAMWKAHIWEEIELTW